jgi:hypothetical protein
VTEFSLARRGYEILYVHTSTRFWWGNILGKDSFENTIMVLCTVKEEC